MVFQRELFTKVGFDPAITRGEDIDYVINGRIAGYQFYFDPELRITHLPPRHYEAPLYAKTRQDVIRFIYEKAKLEEYGLHANEFKPYPGKLLGDDLIPASLAALQSITAPTLISKYGTPDEIISHATAYAEKHLPKYKSFAKNWPRSIELLENSQLTNKLMQEIQSK